MSHGVYVGRCWPAKMYQGTWKEDYASSREEDILKALEGKINALYLGCITSGYESGGKPCFLLELYHKCTGWQRAHTGFLHTGPKSPAGSFLTTQPSSHRLRLSIVSFFCLRLLLTPFFTPHSWINCCCHLSTHFSLWRFSHAFLGKSLLFFKCTFQKAHGVEQVWRSSEDHPWTALWGCGLGIFTFFISASSMPSSINVGCC